MKKVLVSLILLSVICFFSAHSGFSQEKEEKSRIDKNAKKVNLTVESVVEYLLSNNYDVKKALLEYKGVATDRMKFNSKFDPRIIGSGSYSNTANPNERTQMFLGEETSSASMYAGVSKTFKSGTTISGGVTTYYENVKGAGTSTQTYNITIGSNTYPMTVPGQEMGGVGYQSSIKVELAQELMKNCFGYVDRMTDKKLSNAEWMRKQAVRMKLAGLLVEAVIGFWNVAIADESLKTSQLSQKSTIDIRDLIQRKMKIGLAEREDILEWNGRVIDSTNTVDKAEKILFDAKLAVLRTLDLDPDMEIILGKTFSTEKPTVTFEEAVKDAFIKRVDWNSQKVNMKNAVLDYKIAKNNLLPSLKLKGSFGNKDYDSDWENTFDDFNEEYSVGVEFNYPLGDRYGDAQMRTARLNIQQQHLETQNMEKEIRDEVLSIIKECEVTYKVYAQTQKATELKRQYYEQVLKNFNRGQYSALKVKLALDDYIMSRTGELQSKVNYNIALLRREFSRNVVFERFGIDIDAILKKVEN